MKQMQDSLRPLIKNKFLQFTLIAAVLIAAMPITLVSAQTTNDKYIWSYVAPTNIATTATASLKTLASQQANRVIDVGHLAPFRTIYGELDTHYYWYQNFDSVYTLTLLAPYVDSTTRARIQTFIKQEMQTYPLWSATYLDTQVGFKREPDTITANERGSIGVRYAKRPKLFATYALWQYANTYNDWSYIESNWTAISNFYNTYRAETTQFYTSIAGAIGMARLAYQKPTRDTTMVTRALGDVNAGFAAGVNLDQFGLNAENAYQAGSGGWPWMREGMYLGFQFMNITPEIGRFMNENTTLRAAVLGTGSVNSIYSLKTGEHNHKLWYVSQSPAWSRYYGESSGQSPDTRAMIFPLKMWVENQTYSQLAKYIDVGDALVGDFYLMQQIARTMEVGSTPCWENIQTTTAECPVGSAPTTSTSATACATDLNQDTVTNALDLSILVNDLFKTVLSNPRSDIDKDGKVDLSDYSQIARRYLQPCQ